MNRSFNKHLPVQMFIVSYLGIDDKDGKVKQQLIENNHTALLRDKEIRRKIEKYLDITQIPDIYKKGRSYYEDYKNINLIFMPEYLDEINILLQESSLANRVKDLYNVSFSPLFADQENLIGLPKAYFVILEWDTIKDGKKHYIKLKMVCDLYLYLL